MKTFEAFIDREIENHINFVSSTIFEKAPPGAKAERFIKKNKKSFKKRYGKDAERVLYATAWKMFGEGAVQVNEWQSVTPEQEKQAVEMAKQYAIPGPASFNKCTNASVALGKALLKAGIDCFVVRVSGLRTKAPKAHKKWAELGNQFYWVHYVVKVGNTVIDLTRHQFFPEDPCPFIQTWDQCDSEWEDISLADQWREVRQSMLKEDGAPMGDRSIMPAPQRWLDPSAKEFKPNLAPFAKGGRYLSMPDKTDVTGETVDRAHISVAPGGRAAFKVSHNKVEPPSRTAGRLIKTNLFKQKAGWKWADGTDEKLKEYPTIISVETGNHHIYCLHVDFVHGVTLTRYENSASEPRLRPTTRGSVQKGEVVATVLIRGREHPVYDRVTVRGA